MRSKKIDEGENAKEGKVKMYFGVCLFIYLLSKLFLEDQIKRTPIKIIYSLSQINIKLKYGYLPIIIENVIIII